MKMTVKARIPLFTRDAIGDDAMVETVYFRTRQEHSVLRRD